MKTLFKVKSRLALLLALPTPASGFAANYCIATNGGFGHGGTTIVRLSFLPSLLVGFSTTKFTWD
ncbi:MAG TPA: hypothetical protein VEI52_00280 [Terriglobales bacterium]|nr:hypothetical protein [Terriglobales bacterium]